MVGLGSVSDGHPIVIIVDDNEVDRIVCRRALESTGCSTSEAATGEQGLEMSRLRQPDIVIVDYALPDMNGLQFLANIPLLCPEAGVILLTGYGDEQLAVRALKAGSRDYVVKSPSLTSAIQQSVAATYREMLRERELLRSRHQHDAMLRAMPDAVLRVSMEGEVLEQGNIRLVEPKNSFPEQSLSSLHSCIGSEQSTFVLAAVHKAVEEQQIVQCEFTIESESGVHWYDANVAACGQDQAVIVVRDVSASKQVRQRLEDALEDAHAATHAKSVFLANMSHEIRTPMNGVLGMAEILQQGELDEDQKEQVGLILQSGRALLKIIDDILDTSKVEAGKFELECFPVDLRALLRRSCAVVRVKASEKSNKITLSVDPKLPPAIAGDPTRIQQVVLNYLSNANKFTEDGEVFVSATMTSDEPTQILCEVRDTGIGIPEDKLSRLFLPFSQVDASTRRRFGGTGLGLALSKQLVELMGGTVGVTSETGQGSRFWFKIPCQVAEQATSLSRKSSLAPQRNLRVLVAEDNVINQKVTSRLLDSLGHQCVVVENGLKLLEEMEINEYDVILMDCHMPELDGYGATQQLRGIGGAGARIPIIALTASAMPEDRALARQAGMDDFLSKPVTRAGLSAVLTMWGEGREESSLVSLCHATEPN